MQNSNKNVDLSQSILSLIFFISIILLSFLVMRPFFIGFSWASMLVISTWPIMLKIQNFLWGKRSLAVISIVTILFLACTIPFVFIIRSLIEISIPFFHWFVSQVVDFSELFWLQDIPIFGNKIFVFYQELLDRDQLICEVKPYMNHTTEFFFLQAKNLILFFIHLLLMFACSIILYWNGEKFSSFIQNFAYRLSEKNGNAIVSLSIQVIRSVALGIIVTSLIQAFLSGIGIIFASVPYSTLLIMCIILSCIIQIGSLPILIPSIIWLYFSNNPFLGTALLIWSIFICILDNILRPYLIRMGSDFPILLILSGVIGGLLTFGVIGLFIGPVVLVIGYRLLLLWIYNISISSLLDNNVVKKNKKK